VHAAMAWLSCCKQKKYRVASKKIGSGGHVTSKEMILLVKLNLLKFFKAGCAVFQVGDIFLVCQ
jgi:hypothetical protein